MRRARHGLAVERIRQPEGQAQTGGAGQAESEHHRADLWHFQHAVRSGGNPPAGGGHRLRGEPGVPARHAYQGHPETRRRGCEYLHVPRIRYETLRGTGQTLFACPDGDFCHHKFPAQTRRTDWRRSRALHRARKGTDDQADLGPLAQRDAGFFRDRLFCRRGDRHLRAGVEAPAGGRARHPLHLLLLPQTRREAGQ